MVALTKGFRKKIRFDKDGNEYVKNTKRYNLYADQRETYVY